MFRFYADSKLPRPHVTVAPSFLTQFSAGQREVPR